MVLLKSFCYTIADPTMKHLYTPLDETIQSSAHAWIDIAGTRFSKQVGTMANVRLDKLSTHLNLQISLILLCVPLIFIWLYSIRFTGNRFLQMEKENKTKNSDYYAT